MTRVKKLSDKKKSLRLLEIEIEGLRRLAEYTNQDFADYLTREESVEYWKLIEQESV